LPITPLTIDQGQWLSGDFSLSKPLPHAESDAKNLLAFSPRESNEREHLNGVEYRYSAAKTRASGLRQDIAGPRSRHIFMRIKIVESPETGRWMQEV
jgi:hypothetical protein